MKKKRLAARGSCMPGSTGLAACVTVGCLLAVSACGGGDADMATRAEASGRAVALASGLETAPASINLFQVPVPAGTTRVFQRGVASSASLTDPVVAWRAEDMLAEFDASRVPIYVVACDTVREAGVEAQPATRPFVLVLDIRVEDLPFATARGYAPLTAQLASSFSVVQEGRCAMEGMTITPEQRIHGLARRSFSGSFSGWSFSGTEAAYRYRYYTGTRNYLGLAGNDVYVHNGRDWNWLRVGQVSDFIPFIDGIPAAQFPAAVPAGATRMRLLGRVGPDFGQPESEIDFLGTHEWAENIVSGFDARQLPINIVACNYYSGPGGPAIAVDMAVILDVRDADIGYARSRGFAPLTAHQPIVLIPNPNACSPSDSPGLTPARRIFGLARRLHAQTFVGSRSWGDEQGYLYEYYSVSRNYLGVAGDGVYMHNGRDLNYQRVGSIRDFIPFIDGIPRAASSPGP